jgi:spectinomycin phosphotransferase
MLVLAPKERDLMFIGGGVGHAWNQPAGRGAASTKATALRTSTPVALAYYRYERITRDILEISDQVFDASASTRRPRRSLRQMASQFQPDDVVAIAHRSYDAVT